MNLSTSVTESTDTREDKPLGLLAANAQLIIFWGQHTLPTPTSVHINAGHIDLGFSSREALDAWYAALGPSYGEPEVRTQPYSYKGSDETLHNASSRRWGHYIALSASTPAVLSTEPLDAETTAGLAEVVDKSAEVA